MSDAVDGEVAHEIPDRPDADDPQLDEHVDSSNSAEADSVGHTDNATAADVDSDEHAANDATVEVDSEQHADNATDAGVDLGSAADGDACSDGVDSNGDDARRHSEADNDDAPRDHDVVLDVGNMDVAGDEAVQPALDVDESPDPAADASRHAHSQSRASKAESDAMSASASDAASATTGSNKHRAMVQHATSLAKMNRLGAGNKSAFQAKMSDIGALGIGLQLYFMLTKYLSVTFLLMGIVALPTMILHNAGHGITVKMVDPLQLAYASLGNEGVNDAIASDPKQCLPVGSIDCNWTTVDTPFTTNPVTVAWIITISDCVYSLVFGVFYVVYRVQAVRVIETHLNENLTPAKYAVYVRGLPADATEREILAHFNERYDPTQDEAYFPLWFGCCWGRRRCRRATHSQSKHAVNKSVVTNVDHLAGATSMTPSLYLNTWVAEVSVAHPTGGLLRTFLAMEALTQRIAETRSLVELLERETRVAAAPVTSRDAKLLARSTKQLAKLCAQLETKKSTIKALQQVRSPPPAVIRSGGRSTQQAARAKVKAAAKAAKTAATATQQAFNWDACSCAFVVFNNVESRRRCLEDYRRSTTWRARVYQPALLRFRNGTHRLIVTPAPEPANILWENLEVTDRGRMYRRALTSCVTLVLLLVSAMIISAAQSAQQQFADKLPPTGLCETKLPQVFYGSTAYATKRTRWKLVWDEAATCSRGAQDEPRYAIAYDNGIVNALNISRPVVSSDSEAAPYRCVDPCVSEQSSDVCSTLPCFDQDRLDAGDACETYAASHVLYCYCSTALATSIADAGYIDGPKLLWRQYIPCRGYITDFAKKNGFIVLAAGVVVVVNLAMDSTLRWFADFERHTSESAKASGIALKLFVAQFLNTAIVVLLVNASLGLTRVPVLSELLKGKYRDFERDWYPTVGMGITTTMLLNAFLPQLQLFVRMFVVAPLKRELTRRSVRTQAQMNRLFAGPAFDITSRYPMLLNSVFVTMAFSGGSPILLFIAAVAAAGTYWFDKLSLVYLYSVKTTYDEELGDIALGLLPWTLALHLGFSTWMYGNTQLLKAHLLDIATVLNLCGMASVVTDNPDATNDELYDKLLARVASIDVLGQYGLLVKVLRSNVMLIFLFFAGTVITILLATVWRQVLWPLVRSVLVLFYRSVYGLVGRNTASSPHQPPSSSPLTDASSHNTHSRKRDSPVVLPEFTDVFRKSVRPHFRPDTRLGFARIMTDDADVGGGASVLVRTWQEPTMRRYGIKRNAGERMRTYEAMQAPTRSYAIEMNEKYALAVAEIAAAAAVQRRVSSLKPGAVAPVLGVDDESSSHDDSSVLRAVAATDAVETSDDCVADVNKDDTRPSSVPPPAELSEQASGS